MNKKILLSLGSLSSALIPVSAVIACSPGTKMGEEESKFLAALKSNVGFQKINNAWIDKSLAEVYKNGNNIDNVTIRADLLSYAKFFINDKLVKDNQYLNKLKTSWSPHLKNDIERGKLDSDYVMGGSYHNFNEWETSLTNTTNKKTFASFITNYLFDNNNYEIGNPDDPNKGEKIIAKKTDFLLKLKQALITKQFLSISKTEWKKVFGDEEEEKLYDGALDSNQATWDLIDEDKFPLILEGMRKHYAYSWNINLTERNFVNKYIEKGEEKAQNIIAAFEQSNELGKKLNYQNYQNKIVSDFVTIDSSSYAGYVGYKGVQSLPQGKSLINFSWDDSKNWTDRNDGTKLKGFVNKNKLISGTEKLPWVGKNASAIDLTYFEGESLIPTYDDATSKKIKFSNVKKGQENNLFWIFISKNQGLYRQAVKYYTNKDNPIMLEVKDNYIKKILIDEGMEFIKE